MVDSNLKSKGIPLTGKLITSEDPVIIGTNFRTIKNMRYTRTNPKGIGGHTKINSTALTTYTHPRSAIHFRKEQPAESHVLVESYNSALTASEIYDNQTAVPDAGNFGSSIYTPTATAGEGRWSLAPNGYVAYANGEETCIWGGDEASVGGFINYDPADTFFRDYTDQILNINSTGSENVATLKRVTESTTDDVLLLHLENNDTDASSSTHTLTDTNVTYNSSAKKFGSYGAILNGTNANFVVPTHADFEFDGADATWTIDYWGTVDDLDNIHYFYYKQSDATNYFTCFITAGGAVRVSHFDTGAETLNSTVGFFTSDGIIEAGTQYHIEVVRNASSWYIFVNGDLKQNMTDTTDTGTESGDVLIGTNGTLYYDGDIDEYRVSDIARHTSSFEVPIAAYGDRTVTYMYVGTIMPLEGIKFYVSTANATSSTAAVNYWSGSAWEAVGSLSDGTASGGKSLAQTGTMSFNSTTSTAKVKSIKGVIVYWYRVSITSMDDDVGVYYITAKTPFQTIKDIWDGISHKTLSFFKYDGSYNDFTGNVREDDYDSGNAATFVNVHGLTASQSLIAGFSKRQTGIRFNILGDSNNTAANTTMSVDYWDGGDWATVGTIFDGTSEDNISFAQSGLVSWEAVTVGLEFLTEFTGSLKVDESVTIITEPPSLYYYRITFDKTLSGPSSAISLINVNSVPAQEIIGKYKFTMLAMERLWLFSDQKGKKNTSLCSSYSTTNVFNGDDSIMIQWGDESELMGSAWLYSQYGASVFSILVVFKKSETWVLIGNTPYEWRQYRISSSVGCVAPETIRVLELPASEKRETNRSSIVIFQGSNGLYMTDGRPPVLISHDIINIFDKRETTKINADMIAKARSFIDIENNEYHWCFSIGSEVDTEYVLDYKKMRFFEIDRPSALQCGIEVEDVNGATYTYGFIDTGTMLRLENGNSFDGSDITQTFQFGDIALHDDSVWIETIVDYHNLISVTKTTTNDITVTHYGDTASSSNTLTMVPRKSGFRTIRTSNHEKFGPHLVHSWKFEIVTNDEAVGFEPLFFTCLYKIGRQYIKDYRS